MTASYLLSKAPIYAWMVVGLVILICFRRRSRRATALAIAGIVGHVGLFLYLRYAFNDVYRWLTDVTGRVDLMTVMGICGNLLFASFQLLLVAGVLIDRGRRPPVDDPITPTD